MKQLHLPEYLKLLDRGVTGVDAQLQESEWLQQAEDLWPDLKIDAWEKRKRKVEYIGQCGDGTRIVHISASRKNCFLILVVPPKKKAATRYMLFDIGAEYAEIQFNCPEFDIHAPAEKAVIRKCIPKLDGSRNPFAILAAGDGTYIQAYVEDGVFEGHADLGGGALHQAVVGEGVRIIGIGLEPELFGMGDGAAPGKGGIAGGDLGL